MLPILLIGIVTAINSKTPIIGRVLDQEGSPVTFAKVCSGNNYTTTDINGFFLIENSDDSLKIEATSFQILKVCTSDLSKPIILEPKEPEKVITLK